MLTTIKRIFNEMQKTPFFLHYSARFYRFLRVFCCLLEEKVPEISWRAGFKQDLGWLEELGFEREEY